MLRQAALSDVEQILDLHMRAKPRTVYATVLANRDVARRSVRQCISGPQAFAMVVEHEGVIRAALLGVKEGLWFSSRREAKDITFVSEDAMASCALVDAFKSWAWQDPLVVHVILAQSSGVNVEATDRWMEKMEFERVGGVFLCGRWDVEGQRVAI